MNRRGFTLVEVIVVISLLTILLAMATPSMIAWRENARNKEIAREVLGGLRQARSIAVTEGQTVTFTLNPGTRQMTFSTVTRQLPAGVSIRARAADSGNWTTGNSDVEVEFASQGNASTLYQVQVNEEDRLTVRIESTASGLARID